MATKGFDFRKFRHKSSFKCQHVHVAFSKRYAEQMPTAEDLETPKPISNVVTDLERRAWTGAGEASVTEAFSAGTNTAYSEPWLRRVRDVDDDTLDPLLRMLVLLRRIRGSVTVSALIGGALAFGIPRFDAPTGALLIYGTLALTFAMPVHAVGALAVRRLFLVESRRHGLSRSAALLLLTRAERRARHLPPFLTTATTVEKLRDAVRDPDRAD